MSYLPRLLPAFVPCVFLAICAIVSFMSHLMCLVPDMLTFPTYPVLFTLLCTTSLVPYILSRFTYLVLYVPSSLTSHILCPTWSRVLCPTSSYLLRVLCLLHFRASCTSCRICSRASRALVPHVSRALRALVLKMLSYLKCSSFLVSCIVHVLMSFFVLLLSRVFFSNYFLLLKLFWDICNCGILGLC